MESHVLYDFLVVWVEAAIDDSKLAAVYTCLLSAFIMNCKQIKAFSLESLFVKLKHGKSVHLTLNQRIYKGYRQSIG